MKVVHSVRTIIRAVTIMEVIVLAKTTISQDKVVISRVRDRKADISHVKEDISAKGDINHVRDKKADISHVREDTSVKEVISHIRVREDTSLARVVISLIRNNTGSLTILIKKGHVSIRPTTIRMPNTA
jgi:hypothetical protein